ncbi:hypothetical protein Tco_1215361 [Tanacetum coccineum]
MSMMGVLTYFLGFHIKQSERGISINQEKYVKDLLKKYDINGSLVKTLMVPPNNLGPDLNGKAVNETQYRGFDLKEYSDSDYARCNMDKKSTSALQSTPVDKNRAFSPPSTPDTLIEFVNELGYPREVINLSNVTTNDMFQPWRALTTIINLCLTGKTSGFESQEPQNLIFYHNFTAGQEGNLAQQAQGKEEADSHSDPSISSLLAKGPKRESLRDDYIPNELINDVIRGSDYYDAYLEKVAKHQRYLRVKNWLDVFIDEGVRAARPGKTDSRKLLTTAEVREREEKVGEEPVIKLVTGVLLKKMPSVVRSGAQDEGQAGPDPVKEGGCLISKACKMRAPLCAAQDLHVFVMTPSVVMHVRTSDVAKVRREKLRIKVLLTTSISSLIREVSQQDRGPQVPQRQLASAELLASDNDDTELTIFTTIHDDLYMDDETTVDETGIFSGEEYDIACGCCESLTGGFKDKDTPYSRHSLLLLGALCIDVCASPRALIVAA